MRAQSRSIQAPDDPERLFGERPRRRRHKTREDDVSGDSANLLPHHENAVVVFASVTDSK